MNARKMEPNFKSQEELIWCLHTLLRFLLCRSPFVAETAWASHQANPDLPKDQWIERRNPLLGTNWTYVSSDGWGRNSRVRPAKVPDDQILVIKDSPGPHFELRRIFESLVPQVRDVGCRQQFEQVMPRLYAFANGTFELDEMTRFLGECRAKYHNIFVTSQVDRPLHAFLWDYTNALPKRFVDYELPGYFIGVMRLLNLAWLEWGEIAYFSPIWREVNRDDFLHTDAFVNRVFHFMENIEGPERVELAATHLYEEGSRLLDEALEVETEGEFYGRLYKSCANFHGAYEGFEWLSKRNTVSLDKKKDCKKMLNVCEEFRVITRVSLMMSFQNSYTQGSPFSYHKDRVTKARAKGGESAARDVVDEMLELHFFYPKSFREPLIDP